MHTKMSSNTAPNHSTIQHHVASHANVELLEFVMKSINLSLLQLIAFSFFDARLSVSHTYDHTLVYKVFILSAILTVGASGNFSPKQKYQFIKLLTSSDIPF